MQVLAAAALALAGNSCGSSNRQRLHVWQINPPHGESVDNAEKDLYRSGIDVFTDGDATVKGNQTLFVAATTAEAESLKRTLGVMSRVPDKAIPAGYSNLDQVNQRLHEYEEKFPGVAKVVDMTARYGGARSYEGRPIYGLKVSDNVEREEDEDAVLVVAAHHCREIGSPEMVFGGIDILLQNYKTPGWAQRVVENHQVYFIPVVNVDGYVYTFTVDNMWRKNRRPLETACGVDLNRNYPAAGSSLWDGACSGSTTESSNTYRGPWPASEREAQMLAAFHHSERPVKVIDFHQSGREVLYGYQCHEMPKPIADWTVAQAQQLADKASYALRKPSADGEHPQHANGVATDYSFLIEVTTTFQPPHATTLDEVERVKPLLQHFFTTAVSVRGHVTTRFGGVPIGGARVDVDELHYSNGESRHADGRYGRYAMWLPDGKWTLTFSAPGFSAQKREVTVVEGATEVLDVSL